MEYEFLVQREKVGQTSRATEPPNSHPAPRGLTAQFSTSSGSDHIRSKTGYTHKNSARKTLKRDYIPQKAPSCGISCARDKTRIWSSVRISGDRPPWTQSVSPSIICVCEDEKHVRWETRGRTDCCEIQVIENITTGFPYGCAAVFLLAFICI